MPTMNARRTIIDIYKSVSKVDLKRKFKRKVRGMADSLQSRPIYNIWTKINFWLLCTQRNCQLLPKTGSMATQLKFKIQQHSGDPLQLHINN